MMAVYVRHQNRLTHEQAARVQSVRDELAALWSQLMPNVHDDTIKAAINAREHILTELEEQDPAIAYMTDACTFLNQHAHAEAKRDSLLRSAQTDDERNQAMESFRAQERAITRDFLEALHPDLVQSYLDAEGRSNSGGTTSQGSLCSCGERAVAATPHATLQCHNCGGTRVETDHGWICKYQRINHLREVLRQKMATQTRPPPPEVEMLVRVELYKRRSAIAMTAVTPGVVITVLRDNRQSRYFKYATAIAVRINPNYQPQTIAPADYERIVYMFVCAEGPFEQIKRRISHQRKNFMSYDYACHQICVLCGFTQYLPMFGLLKSVALQQQSDMFWREVCKLLRWPFNPTVGNARSARDFRVITPMEELAAETKEARPSSSPPPAGPERSRHHQSLPPLHHLQAWGDDPESPADP
jgi:hypothetical protein